MSIRFARMIAVAGVTVALSGGILATAQPASAVPGLVTAQRTSVIDSTAQKAVGVSCPTGTRAIGGSAVVGGSTKIHINTEVVDTTSFWVVASEPRAGVSQNWYVVVTAECAPASALPGLEYRRVDSAYTSSTTHTAVAACSAGKELIGVGGLIDSNGAGQDKLVLTAIRPASDLSSVVVAAHEDEGGYTGNWRATAVAACAYPVGQRLATAQSAFDSTSSRQATAICPAGTRVHSGGFDLRSGLGQVNLRTSYLDPDVPSDPFRQGFVAQAQEDQTGFASSWHALAFGICAA
jgi:hypothetical protein